MQKQHRTSKPKVRTGCITCKGRHMKCDELKPTCLRCRKAGIECGGYRAPRHDSEVTTTSTRRNGPVPILPRPKHERRGTSQDLLTASLNPVIMDRDDVLYYDLFRHQLVHDLGGHIHFHFWGHIVLRETMRDECVRRAVIAIGALAHAFSFTSESRSQCIIRTSFFPTWSCTEDSLNTSHRAAIRSYISALSLCKKRIQEGAYNSSPRQALIITLVLVAFEFLQGNMNAADGLMKSCILLFTRLRCLLGRKCDQPGLSPRPAFGAADAVDGELEHMLPCLSVMSGFTRLCTSQHDLLASLPVGSGEVFPNLERASVTEALAQWTDFYTRNLVFVMQMQRNHCYGYPYVYAEIKAARDEFLAHQEMWSKVMNMHLACEEDPHIIKGIKIARIHHAPRLTKGEETEDSIVLLFKESN